MLTLVLALMSLAACTGNEDAASPASSDDAVPPSGQAALPAEEVNPLVEQISPLGLAAVPPMRLAEGLTPPTNRWFSGLVFGSEPQPVFPLPLAFILSDSSFGAGLPRIVTSADGIVGSHQADVTVDVADARSSVVAAYDVASVTIEHRDADGAALGRTTVVQGSPFVTHVAQATETLQLSSSFSGSGDVVRAETAGGEWGMRLDGATVEGDTLTLDKGEAIVLFPVPEGHRAEELGDLAAPVTGSSASFSVDEDTVSSELAYETDAEESVYGVLPHQESAIGDGCRLGTLPTVYGTMTLCALDRLSWTAPRRDASAELDLSGLGDADRRELAEQVTADVDALPDPPADTYFGGKWAYRTAQLMSIARQVDASAAATEAQRRLEEVLRRWTEVEGCRQRDAFCFGYDADWKGVVGQVPAFGSEQFNDHHFHYGYFLYAAGVLATEKPAVADDLRPVITLLAADIASGSDTGPFPQWRAFDVYASHSWASGTSDFADGNNQESSSEAVNAWAGLLLWARATGDEDLVRQATWMMSSEAQAARTYWTDFDRSQPVYDGFEHGVVGINWGGKRDYATWFSAEPSAILGIQLIPMSPSSGYLAGDPERILSQVDEISGGPLADYALLYAGLAGRTSARTALDQARQLPAGDIDQGNSRSYLLAFLMSRAS